MALKGNLHDFSLTQLLNLVHLAHKTGTLTVHGTNDQASLSFSEGKLVYGQGGVTDGHLVSILRHTKHLTEEQARLLLSRPQANNDKELGLLLIHAGYLSQQTIVQAVQQYITDLVLRLFTWSEGSFQFFNGVLPPDDRITVRLDLENLILEGARRMKEWETLQEEIPNLDLALKFTDRPDSRLRGINLTVEEWRVVSYVNPKNTIRQIAHTNRLSDVEIRRIVYGLMQSGVVEVVRLQGDTSPAAPRITPIPKTPEQASLINRLIGRIRSL